MQLDQRLDQGQAQTRAAAVAADEAVEDVRLDVERHAAAGVADGQPHLARRPHGRQGHGPAGRGLAQGVLDQVIERLHQPLGVAADQADVVGPCPQHQRDLRGLGRHGPAASGVLQQVADPHVTQVQRHLVGVDGGDVEHVVDRPAQLDGGLAHGGKVRAAALGDRLAHAVEQFRIADDRRQRRAQFIGDVADELALEPLGAVEGRLAVGQGAFQLAGVGDVGEGDQGRAVGQRPGLPGDDAAERVADLARGRGAGFGIGIADPALEFAPEGHVVQARHAQFDDPLEVDPLDQVVLADGPEAGKGLVVQPQPAVGAEHHDRVVELVERRLLHLDQGVVLGAQPHLAGDVRIEQQQAAHRVRLADQPQGAAVGQRPAVVRLGSEGLVAGQLGGLPLGVVGRLGKPLALAQPVEDLPVCRPLGQPGGVEAPQVRKSGVVERQPAGRAKDGHRLGDVVQRFVVSGDVALERVLDLLGLGGVGGPDRDPAAVERLGGDLQRPAAAAERDPAGRLAAQAEVGRLAGDSVGPLVERQTQAGGVAGVAGADRGQPGLVGPLYGAVRSGDPGRLGPGVEEGGQARGARQGGLIGPDGRQPQPGQGAGGAALDRDNAPGPAGLEGAGLAAFEQGAQPGGMVGIGAHDGVDHALRIGPGQAEGRRAGLQVLLAGGQQGAAVVDHQQAAVEGLGRGLGGGGAAFDGLEPVLHHPKAPVHRPALHQRPQHRADRQADGARRGGDDQLHLRHL